MSAQLASRFKWLTVCLLCFGLFLHFAGAQSTTQGAVAGTVVDASGAMQPFLEAWLRSAAPQMPPLTQSANMKALFRDRRADERGPASCL